MDLYYFGSNVAFVCYILVISCPYRFIGTTPDSSAVSALLASVTKQIKLIYNQDPVVPEVCYALVKLN
jgi:hypothetical protein